MTKGMLILSRVYKAGKERYGARAWYGALLVCVWCAAGAAQALDFAAVQHYAVGAGPRSVVVADCNGDGLLDLIVGNSTANSISVLLGNGDGTFQAPVTGGVGGDQPWTLAALDANGDGLMDVAAACMASHSVRLLMGRGDGAFDLGQSLFVSGEPRGIAAGFLNGDGHVDLVTANYQANDVCVLIGQGNGNFGMGPRLALGVPGPCSVSVAQLVGDAALDLVVAGYQSSSLAVVRGIGNGSFQAAMALPSGGGGPVCVITADVSEAWVARYDAPWVSWEQVGAMTLDAAGNVVVTGNSSAASDDFATVKYDTGGNELWVRRYDGPGGGNDHACQVAVDADGNVYVTGWSVGETTGEDYTTIKYTPTGRESTLSVALPAVQPAGCLVNRWMPFWLEVRGGCPLESPTQRIHGFEFYLAYDPSVLACDLEGDGSWNDIDFTGTVCQWDCGSGPEGPDLAFLSDVEIEGTRYLHVGVVFDNTPDACEKTLACMAPDGVLARIRVHTLNFPDPQNPGVTATDLSFGTGALLPYYVRHEAGGVPEEVPVAAPAGLAGLEIAAAPLFIRGNATGDADSDPLPAPPADPRSAIDINDGLRILRYLFVDPSAHPIGCMESADANDDGRVNLLDAVYVLQWVFGTAADFPAPLSRVGVDDDGDAMDCVRSQI